MDKNIKRIMSNIFEIQEDEISDDSSIDKIESWDSLKHINLIIALEEHFGISVNEEEMLEMISYADIKRILKDKGVSVQDDT